jgi:type II secretory pathway predicted ATPase ExeA
MKKELSFLSRFSFHTTPFTREIETQDRFQIEENEKHLEYLQRVLEKKMSAAIVAPAGTGKTMLLRTLTDRLPETRYHVSYLKVTSLSKRDLCREISKALELQQAGNYPTLVRRIQDRFSSTLEIEGRKPILVFDEIQDIRPEVLGLLNILTNFEMDSKLVVGILLAGQPRLKELLSQSRLESVARRMAHFVTLKLLSPVNHVRYIEHRCRVAGAGSSPFDEDSIRSLYELTQGNFRATDYLSLKSLEVAHDHDRTCVNANHVIEARSLLWP